MSLGLDQGDRRVSLVRENLSNWALGSELFPKTAEFSRGRFRSAVSPRGRGVRAHLSREGIRRARRIGEYR